jgi:hypothetical protein
MGLLDTTCNAPRAFELTQVLLGRDAVRRMELPVSHLKTDLYDQSNHASEYFLA